MLKDWLKKINLQIQCTSHQYSDAIIHRNRKILKCSQKHERSQTNKAVLRWESADNITVRGFKLCFSIRATKAHGIVSNQTCKNSGECRWYGYKPTGLQSPDFLCLCFCVSSSSSFSPSKRSYWRKDFPLRNGAQNSGKKNTSRSRVR